jgi:hypothetical protein
VNPANPHDPYTLPRALLLYLKPAKRPAQGRSRANTQIFTTNRFRRWIGAYFKRPSKKSPGKYKEPPACAGVASQQSAHRQLAQCQCEGHGVVVRSAPPIRSRNKVRRLDSDVQQSPAFGGAFFLPPLLARWVANDGIVLDKRRMPQRKAGADDHHPDNQPIVHTRSGAPQPRSANVAMQASRKGAKPGPPHQIWDLRRANHQDYWYGRWMARRVFALTSAQGRVMGHITD